MFDLPIIKDPKKKKKTFDDTQAGEILMQHMHLQLGVFTKPHKSQKLHQNHPQNGITAQHCK